MALGLGVLGHLYGRTQKVSQNLTKEKIKNELAWMAGNAAICGAAKVLTAATLATFTPAAIATAASIAVGGVLATSIRHIKEQVDADVKKEGNADSRLKLAARHLNSAEIWDHMKTSQFRTRLLLNWGVSIGTFGLLDGTDIGHTITEHAGKALQKTSHWLSDRANAAFSMLKDAIQLDAKHDMSPLPAVATSAPAPAAAVVPDAPAVTVTTTDAPAAAAHQPSDTLTAAAPSAKMSASELIAEKHLKTPQAIKDYAYNLLNGKNGVTADPEAAIALYKHVAPINPQARLDLEYLASQKKYESFGLKDYLKSNPALATHTPATGIAAAKPLAPTKPGRIRIEFPAAQPNPTLATSASVPVADPNDLSVYFPHETTEPPSATRVVMECTTGLTPDNIQHIDLTKPLEPVCNVLTNYAFAGDRMVIDGQEMYKALGPRTFTLEWAGRLVEEFTARKAAFLRAAAEKFAAVAAPSPAPVTLAAAPIPTDLAPQ